MLKYIFQNCWRKYFSKNISKLLAKIFLKKYFKIIGENISQKIFQNYWRKYFSKNIFQNILGRDFKNVPNSM